MVLRVLDEKPVSLAKVREVIDKRKKDAEMSYEQKQTMEYVKEFAKMKPDKAEDAIEKLVALGVDRRHAVKVMDIMPEDEDDLKMVFYKAHYSVNEQTVNQIMEILKDYR